MSEISFLIIGYVAGASSCLVGVTVYIIVKYHYQRHKDKKKTEQFNKSLRSRDTG
jgi:hypothetical protein